MGGVGGIEPMMRFSWHRKLGVIILFVDTDTNVQH